MEKLTLVKVEDREGDGTCGECGREGLRWVATLSDGTGVGVECAKKVLGFKPAVATYAWAADFVEVGRHVEGDVTRVLWRHKTGVATRETTNGTLTAVGGVTQVWAQRGWAV